MAILIQWFDQQQTAVHAIFTGAWDWHEFYAAAGQMVHVMTTMPHPVDILLDLTDSSPAQADFIIRAERASFYRRNTGTVVLIQPGPARHLLKKHARPSRQTFLAPSLDSALQILRQRRLYLTTTRKTERLKLLGS